MNMLYIQNIKYTIHLFAIKYMAKCRRLFGRIIGCRIRKIYKDSEAGIIKIYPWQFKIFKCVTPDDFYIVTGIYDALIKTNDCKGYRNFGFSHATYKSIEKILEKNYKWNEETMWGDTSKIQFTWALGSTPMSIKGVKDWVVLWDKGEVKGEIDGAID